MKQYLVSFVTLLNNDDIEVIQDFLADAISRQLHIHIDSATINIEEIQ